jgi:outer membrane lipoprotein-sorting protein
MSDGKDTMKNKKLFIFLISFILLTPFMAGNSFAASTNLAKQIVSKSDKVRSPQLDYTVDVRVTTVKPGRANRTATYEVLVKGSEKTIIKTISPAIDRGTTILMLGRDLWAFMPDVSKPIRISLQQRLIGDVANGDIARANFSGDYTPRILRTEKIKGRSYYVLELIANDDRVTYGKVVYWVNKKNSHPLKAEFYTASGRLLKTCSYEDYKRLAGRLRPTSLVLRNSLSKGRISIIKYQQMKVRKLPAKYFTKNHMKKLKY